MVKMDTKRYGEIPGYLVIANWRSSTINAFGSGQPLLQDDFEPHELSRNGRKGGLYGGGLFVSQ